ncbi:MAG: chorismate mutase [Bdellovibrionales bacterium]
MKSLKSSRENLQKIDQQILDLFSKRLGLVREISEFKKNKELPVFDPIRELQYQKQLNEAGATEAQQWLVCQLISYSRNSFLEDTLYIEKELSRFFPKLPILKPTDGNSTNYYLLTQKNENHWELQRHSLGEETKSWVFNYSDLK